MFRIFSRRAIAAVVALSAALVVAACGQSVDDPMRDADHVVRGMARFDVPLQLRTNHRMVSELVDISRDDTVLAEQELAPPGNAPIPFELRYGPRDVPDDAELGVRVRLYQDGELQFATSEPARIARERGVDIVEIMLEPTEAGEAYIDAQPSPEELREERDLDPEPYEVDLPPEVEEGLIDSPGPVGPDDAG